MKDTIYLHRSYKKLDRVHRGRIVWLLVLVGLLDLAIGLWHRPLLERFVEAVAWLTSRVGLRTELVVWRFLPAWVVRMPVIDTAGMFPSRGFAVWTLVGNLAVVLIVPHLRRIPKAIRVYAFFLGLLNSVAAAFFVLVPERFPYDVSDFSLLYMGTQLGIWLLLPVVMGLALAPLPAPTLEKFAVILGTGGYAVLFGAIRYATFLYLLRELTVLHMAAMFFALGPLIDFVYMVAIYSIYVNIVALRLRDRPETWRWSF